MARRAQQGAVARCPFCECLLPQLVAECPECRFPLTMAAAEGGYLTSDRSGTTSTATPGGRSAAPVVAGHAPTDRQRAHGSRAHRMRMTAWLLAVTSVLLLLAGLGAVFTATSPEAAGDRQAKVSLLSALNHAAARPDSRVALAVPTVPATEASDAPQKVSADQGNGFWFGAAKSTSGSCWFVAGTLAEGRLVRPGRIDEKGPCSGAEVRRLFEQRQSTSKP